MQKLKLKKEYQKYPEYKDSGIVWLGGIPKEWGADKLKNRSNFLNGYAFNSGDYSYEGLSIIRIGDVGQDIDFNKVKKVPQELKNKISRFRINKGDILIALTGATIGKSSIFNVYDEAYLNQRVGAITARNNTFQKYLYYLILSKIFKENISVFCSGGAQENIGKNEINDIMFAFPQKKEQQKIANFLDEKVDLIDDIVKKKKKLIELLKEKRTAVINQAVNAESLCGMQRLKFSIKTNPSKQVLKFFPDDYLVSFLPMEKVSNKGKINLEDERKLEMVKEGFTYFKNGDVIFAKITPCFENGKGALVDKLKNGIGFGSTEFIVLRANKEINSKYIYYLISSHKFRKIGEVEMRGSAGQKRVPEAFVRNYFFNKISYKKQMEIVKDLDDKMETLDIVVKKVVESINLLNEFKSSLISNVVTGKVKI